MKKKNIVKYIIIFILLGSVIILFLSRAGVGGAQKYFEGKVLENTNKYIVIEVDSQYTELIEKSGAHIKVDTEKVFRKCDFSKFTEEEKVRVVYSEFDSLKGEFEQVYAIYLKSEIIDRS